LNIDWFTLTAQVVNFLILLALLKRFLFGPLRKVMKQREETVTSRLEEAREKLAAAERKSDHYDQKLSEFDRQKEQMLSEARKEVEQQKKEMLQEARTEIDRIESKWQEAFQNEKEIFFSELYRQTAEGIIELLEQMIRDLADRSLEEQAVRKFIRQLESLDKVSKKRAIRSALDSGEGKVELISSFPLPDEQRQKVAAKLNEVFAINLTCEFRESSAGGFGIELRSDSWKIGWNLKMYMDDLRSKIEHLFESDIEIMETQRV
jgi:F-type H+-transporting ATPase subunit b